MLTADHVSEIVDKVRHLLLEAELQGIHLSLTDHRIDDDWLYLVVVPSKSGVRASDYANFMSKIERDLRSAGDDKILLVPALQD